MDPEKLSVMAWRMISAASRPETCPLEIMSYMVPWSTPLASASIPTAPMPRSLRMFRYSSVALLLDFIRPMAVAMASMSPVLCPRAAPASPMVSSTSRM